MEIISKELGEETDIEAKWQSFKTIINQAIIKHIPQRQVSSNNQTKIKQRSILNEKILAKVRKKHRAWQRFLETRDGEKHKEYCKIRNQVRQLARKAKIEHEKYIANNAKQNPKKFWQYTKSRTKTRECVSDLKKDQNGNEEKENIRC